MTILRIMTFGVGALGTVTLLTTFCLCGLCGSASFGATVKSRCLSRLSALVMLGLLATGQHIFSTLNRPIWYWDVAFDVLCLLVGWSFLRTTFSDPGTKDCPEWQAWRKESGCGDLLPPEKEEKDGIKCNKPGPPGRPSFCDKCDHYRPERAHHCQVCGTCVLRMDHHCPLIGNCVGWRNHKYYLVLQWWQFWACVVFLFAPTGPGQSALYTDQRPLGVHAGLLISFSIIWCLALAVISGRTLVVATFMAARNETHIETHKFVDKKNPYMMPSALGNLELLLGKLDLWLLLPVGRSGNSCRGTSFPYMLNKRVDMPKGSIYGSA